MNARDVILTVKSKIETDAAINESSLNTRFVATSKEGKLTIEEEIEGRKRRLEIVVTDMGILPE